MELNHQLWMSEAHHPVIPAKAGIQDLDPGSVSGVTVLSDMDAGKRRMEWRGTTSISVLAGGRYPSRFDINFIKEK